MPIRDDGREPPQIWPVLDVNSLPESVQVNGPAPSAQIIPAAYDWLALQSACGTGLSPSNVAGLVIQLLRDHYRQESNRLLPNVDSLIWNADHNYSTLRIESGTRFDLASAGQLPAILVTRAMQRSQRISTTDKSEEIIGSAGQSEETFSRIIYGTMTVDCVAATDGAAESLAQETFGFLTAFSPLLRRYLPFMDFEAVEFGAPEVTESTGAVVKVRLGLSYAHEYGWRITSSGANFNNLNVSVS